MTSLELNIIREDATELILRASNHYLYNLLEIVDSNPSAMVGRSCVSPNRPDRSLQASKVLQQGHPELQLATAAAV